MRTITKTTALTVSENTSGRRSTTVTATPSSGSAAKTATAYQDAGMASVSWSIDVRNGWGSSFTGASLSFAPPGKSGQGYVLRGKMGSLVIKYNGTVVATENWYWTAYGGFTYNYFGEGTVAVESSSCTGMTMWKEYSGTVSLPANYDINKVTISGGPGDGDTCDGYGLITQYGHWPVAPESNAFIITIGTKTFTGF